MSRNDTEATVGSVGITYRESTPWWPEPIHPAADAPNVVLVVLDDVGFGSLGCFGAEVETPVMDALAREGLQYTNFHVTPLCSPTRAALLTGRNHHSVGMSMLSNADSGFPGKRGSVSNSAATVAEVLCSEGYNTAAFGKWHLAPIDQTTSVGPYDQWPLGRGFERFYGFLEGITDQFYPELVQDNHRIDPPATPDEGYHLSEDLVSHVIDYVSDQKSVAPDKPFFAYLAFGAGHTPHQAPSAYLEKYRGRYDQGWDVIREQRHARQIELGVIPEGTLLAPRNDGVEPWDSFDVDARRVMARMQEAFAAMVDHTDAQLGRLVEHLRRLDILDNTVIIVMADNGASQEGGPIGCVNTIPYENGDEVSLEDNLAMIDEIGGPRANSNYPWGWAQVGNTPLKRYKQNTHAGGVRAPLIISWRGGLEAGNDRIRGQFHSVIDITPTILDITGTRMPEVYRGVHQMPVHGLSLAYTFEGNPAKSRRESQYFEMYGHRAIWHDGWKAVAFHERGSSYDDDQWELYNLDEDFSECIDLAAERPDILNSLIGRWWSEAERCQVFPLDDRNFAERAAMYSSAASPRRRRRFRFYPGMERLPGGVTPLIQNRSYRIDVVVTMTDSDEGVLLSHGDTNGGYTLYVRDGLLHYEHNHQGTRYRVTSSAAIGAGDVTLSLDFVRIGDFRGTARLLVNGQVVGEGEISTTARYMIAWQGIFLGRDALSPVSWDYPAGFDFSGTIHHVDYAIVDDAAEIAHEIFD
jgi:arylsulfatase A-like enzyme